MAFIKLPEGTAPSTPETGTVVAYAKADGFLYSKDDAGTETMLGGTGTALSLAGGNMAGGINSARGNITQHATTMDFFAVTSPDILDGTGSAVTITACVNAPQAGATRKFYPIVATILTHGATFDIAGNVNLTAAAGDCWIIEAKTASTYRVTAVKEDGTAVVGFSASAVAGLGNGRATDITISSAGEVTMPLQPSFLAYNSATDSNVTGDNTSYTVVCDTEIFDQNGDYNNGTGVFTAPVTGRYRLTARALVTELASAHAIQGISLTTSNRSYSVQDIFGSNPYTQRQFDINVLADMDAGDTASFAVVIRSGTKVCDVYGSATGNFTLFAGELVA